MERKLTQEHRREIIEMYRDPRITLAEIAEKYGVIDSYISRVVKQAGEPLRRPKTKYSSGSAKSCPKCGKKIDLKGARFCPFCGSDIRNQNEILAENLEKLTDLFLYIPETQRDGYISTLNTAAAILRNKMGDRKCK